MDFIKDFFYTLLKFLSRNQTYDYKINSVKKILQGKPGLVRFLIALGSQCRLSQRNEYRRIQRGSVKGVWFARGAASRSEESIAGGDGPIILFIHGGAFVTGQAKMYAPWNIDLIKHHKQHFKKDLALFCVDYALAPDQHFPYQGHQCMAAVDYLLRSLSISPARLFISGDSAGGNLALQTLFDLETSKSLAGALIFSPWVNPALVLPGAPKNSELAGQANSASDSWTVNEKHDYITDAFGVQGAALYVPPNMEYETAASSSQLNPVLRKADEFKSLPGLLLCYGEKERLRDQIMDFHDKLMSNGCDVEVMTTEDGVHDWPLSEDFCSSQATYRNAVNSISTFVENKMIHA